MKRCKRHDWRIGAYIGGIGGIKKKRIVKLGIYIRCWNCNKVIKAYYGDKGK